MNEKATVFKPTAIELELGERKYNLVFDLNALCQLETMYDSVDTVIQMLLNTEEAVDVAALATQVKVGEMFVEVNDVTIAGTPLMTYITQTHVKKQKLEDTLNLLWAGCLHENAIYNQHDEITGYNVSKKELGSLITLRNLRMVNTKIMLALLRDIMPPKNEEAPEIQETPAPAEAEAKTLTLVLPKAADGTGENSIT